MSAIERDVVALLSELVAVPSVNPSLSPGGAGEAGIARYVRDWAVREGLDARLVDAESGRPDVVVRGGAAGRRLLLCGHLDTVGLGAMTDPLRPKVEGDRLYGRGAYDMKAGLAAALVACREVARSGLAVEVTVAAVADEEHASLGVQRLLPHLRADAAIVTEPTELAIGVAHKGFVWVEIEVTGVAAHGSRPELGIDAIARTGPVLVALDALDRRLAATDPATTRPPRAPFGTAAPHRIKERHDLLGPGTVHASLIRGGTEPSTIPDRCVLTIERRTLPGETVEDVEREVAELLDGCRAADPRLTANARTVMHRPPLEPAADQAVVRALTVAYLQVRGEQAAIGGLSYWTDAAFLSARGIPTVVFGPVGEGAHADVEWVSLSSTVECTRVLVAAAEELSRRPPAQARPGV